MKSYAFLIALLTLILVIGGCEGAPPNQAEGETPSEESQGIEQPQGEIELSISTPLILASSGYEDGYVLNSNEIVVVFLSSDGYSNVLKLAIFSVVEGTYTELFDVYKSDYYIPTYLVGGFDEDHIWVIYDKGNPTVWYYRSGSTTTLNLDEICDLASFESVRVGRYAYLWLGNSICALDFEEDRIIHVSKQIDGEIVDLVPYNDFGDFVVAIRTSNSASVVLYDNFNQTRTLDLDNYHIYDIEREDEYLYVLASRGYYGDYYVLKLEASNLMKVHEKLIISSSDELSEVYNLKVYNGKVVITVSKFNPFYGDSGGFHEYFIVYNENFERIASPTTFYWMNPFTGSLKDPGYGVDSSGKLWFFLQQDDPVYKGRPSHVLVILSPDGSVVAYDARFDEVEFFTIEGSTGMILERGHYYGDGKLKLATLQRE